MQWTDDTTLPSRGLGLRPIGKSSECFQPGTNEGSVRRTPRLKGSSITGGLCWGVGFALPPPCELARSRAAERPHIVPSGENQPRFPVFFPRNDGSDAARDENRRDRRRFGVGGWRHNAPVFAV